MDPGVLITLINGGAGALVTLAFVIVGFINGWIVPGPVYRDLKQDRDSWRSIADRALTATEKVVPPLKRGDGT